MKAIFLMLLACYGGHVANGQDYKFIHNELYELKDADIYENIEFRNIQQYKDTSASIGHFKNQLLVLDIWFKACSSCIASFKKARQLQLEYGDSVQFLLLTWESKKEVYEYLGKIKPQLLELFPRDLPMVWNDSTAYFFFGFKNQPYLYFKINDQGHVEKAWQGDLNRNIIEFCLGRRETYN